MLKWKRDVTSETLKSENAEKQQKNEEDPRPARHCMTLVWGRGN